MHVSEQSKSLPPIQHPSPWKSPGVGCHVSDTHAPSHVSAAVTGGRCCGCTGRAIESGQVCTSGHEPPFVLLWWRLLECWGKQQWTSRETSEDASAKPRRARSREFLLQRISVAVQRGNAAAVLGIMGRRLDGWE